MIAHAERPSEAPNEAAAKGYKGLGMEGFVAQWYAR